MKNAIEAEGVVSKIISPVDGHYFFGYYDLQPFDSTGRYHLCHRVEFEDRIPEPDDKCTVGMIDLSNNQFIPFGETTAWNFQQGAMLQWFMDDNHVIYNIRQDNKFKSCVQNIITGEKRILPMAIANLSKDCKKAVCVNFSRIYDFRPGYGYSGIPDPFADVMAPDNDGIYIMDTITGSCRLVVTYDTIRKQFPKLPYSEEKLLVNHITFNPSGDKYVFLLRNFPGNGSKWTTLLLVGDDKGNLHQMAEYATHSHYHWKNDNELLITSTRTLENKKLGLYLFNDETGAYTYYPDPDPDARLKDIHCLYSPNRRFISGDGYPHPDGYRWIHFINMENNKDIILGKYYSYFSGREDLEYRCDLHARFDLTGRYLSFDSNHIGNRCVCLIDLSKIEDYWEQGE